MALDGIRWQLDADHLTIQTTRNRVAMISKVNDATFRYYHRTNSAYVLFRIGSPENERM